MGHGIPMNGTFFQQDGARPHFAFFMTFSSRESCGTDTSGRFFKATNLTGGKPLFSVWIF
jgi:hypothetical protein